MVPAVKIVVMWGLEILLGEKAGFKDLKRWDLGKKKVAGEGSFCKEEKKEQRSGQLIGMKGLWVWAQSPAPDGKVEEEGPSPTLDCGTACSQRSKEIQLVSSVLSLF